MSIEHNDTKNDPIASGEKQVSPPESNGGMMEETAVLHDKTEKSCIYPGKPLDAEARQIKLPGCELVSVLGMGGMGCVYLGKQTHLNRLVAVKALKVNVAYDPELKAGLKNEAVTLGAINHPNIVSCYDVIYSKGRIFLMMEYVPGFMSVGSLVKKYGPLPEDIVLHIMLEVLHALAYVNGKGFIHRDIKPDNILVYNEKNFSARSLRELFNDSDTRIKICDFGLAVKALRDAVADSKRTLVQGSPNYMAPEQIVAPDDIDLKADMYALAGTAVFMLTGKPPFQFEDVKEMFAFKLENDIPKLAGNKVKVSAAFAKIIAKMGSANPGDRYDSYAELKRDLEKIQPSIEKNRGFQIMRAWRAMSIVLAVMLLAGAYFFGKDYVMENFFREKYISLTSTLGYWQGERTGWYVWQMPSAKGKVPVLMGDDMLGELKLVQLLESGHTLSLDARRRRAGVIHFKVDNGKGTFLDLAWHCDSKGDSIFFATGNNGKNMTSGIPPLDVYGWYHIQFKLYRKNLLVFVNGEPVHTGFISGDCPFGFSVDAHNVGQIMLKNVNITANAND